MKQYLSRFLTLALIVPALASCAGQLEDNLPLAKKHTVYFSTVVDGQATRTGLSIEGNNIIPDWSKTNGEDVHVFEMMNDSESAFLGEAREVIADEDDPLGAHFLADLDEEITIVVTPPSNPDSESDGAKVLRQGSKTFGAVVAKTKVDETGEPLLDDGNVVFYIPAVQTPDAETLKDPGAEFLVGYSRDGYDSATLEDGETVVDLYFDRVAALSRIGFTEFQGTDEKVISVKINSQGSMTGSVKSSDISFGNSNSVTWTPDTGEGANVLTLSYGDAGVDVPAEGAFYAYFVSMPGPFKINSIEVLTDQYHYTKAFEGGKDLTFDLTKLANLTMDLSTAEKEEISSNVWYKASMLEAGYDYIIVSNGHALVKNSDGEIPNAIEVEVATNNTISIEASEDILWRATAVTSDYGQCTLKNGSVYLYRDGYQANNLKVICEETSSPNYVPWRYDGSYLSNGKTTQYYAYYDGGWKMLLVSEGGTDKPSVTTLLFTNRAPQALDFGPEAIAQYDLYSETWTVEVPTLNGVQTSATYALSEDSNPAVATVDPDGTVHPLSTGTVTIVATAAGNEAFQTGSASYTLTVVNSDPNVKVYHKVTGTADLEVGAQYLLVFEGLPEHEKEKNHNPKVFKPTLATDGNTFIKQEADALAVEIVDGTITSNDYVAGHFTLEEGYYLKADAPGKYLYPSYTGTGTNARGILAAESSASNTLNITIGDNGIASIITKTGTYYLVWSTSSFYFSSNTSVNGDYSTGICLYKLEDNRPAWTMSYSPTAASYDLYTKEWTPGTPTLTSDATTAVTYTSSDESVATVDASGVVTPIKKGTVTISAIAAADATHKRTVASYELTLEDSSPAKVYTRVESAADLTAGDKYLVVYESGSMVFKPLLPSGSHYTSGTDNAISVTISDKTISSNDLGVCELTLEDGYYFYVESVGKYLYPTYNNIDAEDTKNSSHAFSISISDGTATVHRTSNNNDYKLRYSTGSKYFQSSTSSANIALYKLEDNRPAWTMSYSPTAASYDLYTKEWTPGTPVLTSDATTTVTYTSSNESVATVDANGVVTPLKKGTTTITATAEADATHKKTEASFVLTVNDTTPVENVTIPLKKATALTAGQKYILVSNGFALMKDGDDASVVAFNANDLTITVPSTSVDDVKWTLEQKSGSITRGNEYVFSNGTYYFGIAMNTNQQTYTYTVEVNEGRTVSTNVTIQDHNISLANDLIYYAGNSSNYYIYYDGSAWTNAKLGNTATPAANNKTALYVVDDGSGDDPGVEKYYVLVTSEPANWNGKYLIVNTAADGTGSALNGTSTASVTISGGKILSTSTIDGYALTVTSAGEVHPNQTDSSQGLIAYDIKFSDGKWLYWYSSKYQQTSEDQSSRHNKCTLYYDNGGVRLMSAGYNVKLDGTSISDPSKNYLYWTGSAFTMDSSHSSSRVQLYKLEENP